MIDNFIILILTHFVSDWFFQPSKWALKKQSNLKYRFYHSIQYTVLFLPVFYFLNINFLWLFWIFFTHLYIDSYSFVKGWNKFIKGDKNSPMWLQTVQDQILHILVLIPLLS